MLLSMNLSRYSICRLTPVFSPSPTEKAHLLHYSGPVKPWGRLGEAMGQTIWDTYYLPDPWRQFKVLRKAKSKSTRLD